MTTKTSVDYEGRDLEAMGFTPRYSKWITRLFKDFVGSSILEVGSGSGNFTKVLMEEFPQAEITVLEPSQQFEVLQKDPLIAQRVTTYLPGTLADNLSSIKNIDTVIYNNVLEHVEDDQKELELLYKTLPKGARVIVFSPALPVLMSEFDKSIGHYRRYTKTEIDNKFKEAGFGIQKSHYVDIVGILPWFLKYTLMKGTLSPNDAKMYDSIVVPIISALEPSAILPIGKNVLIVGIKE
jgi:ubiquinone/menaquinone biosynthesis C-methylase UbiE